MLIFRQALLRCRRALAEDDPERAEYHNALALVARKTGRYSLALGHLQAALKHATRCAESTRTRLYRNLALLELEGNRPQAAVSAARQALELEPEAENKLLLGRCLLALAQETEAKEFLKQAAQEGDGSTRHQSASLLYCR
jgi:tetratricopeptide (TPR) repeat protein